MVGLQIAIEAALYRSARLENGQWERMRGDTIEFSFWSGGRMVWAFPRPGGVGFASTKSASIACYDYASASWTENSAPPTSARSSACLRPRMAPWAC